jgi:hypothetical protein
MQYIAGMSFINGRITVAKTDCNPLAVQLDGMGIRRRNLEKIIAQAKRVLQFKHKSECHPQEDVSNSSCVRPDAPAATLPPVDPMSAEF